MNKNTLKKRIRELNEKIDYNDVKSMEYYLTSENLKKKRDSLEVQLKRKEGKELVLTDHVKVRFLERSPITQTLDITLVIDAFYKECVEIYKKIPGDGTYPLKSGGKIVIKDSKVITFKEK